eukprot:9647601-Lingulodinium_polyedra.AAC.1
MSKAILFGSGQTIRTSSFRSCHCATNGYGSKHAYACAWLCACPCDGAKHCRGASVHAMQAVTVTG